MSLFAFTYLKRNNLQYFQPCRLLFLHRFRPENSASEFARSIFAVKALTARVSQDVADFNRDKSPTFGTNPKTHYRASSDEAAELLRENVDRLKRTSAEMGNSRLRNSAGEAIAKAERVLKELAAISKERRALEKKAR
jgi:hypothetical protein